MRAGLPTTCKMTNVTRCVGRQNSGMHTHGFAILTDRQQIACWLGELLLTYGELPHPEPLHGADFRRLLNIQKPVKERIIEAVFNDPGFTHIEKKVLYKAYRLLSDKFGASRQGARSRVLRHCRDVAEGEQAQRHQREARANGRRSPAHDLA